LSSSPEHAGSGALSAKLDAIDCGVRERFPQADAYIRIGLDAPVV
jgi:hypothetical protein